MLFPKNLQAKIDERMASNSLRTLKLVNDCVDFSSNDYLGIATQQLLPPPAIAPQGSTGSRTLSGNNQTIEAVEDFIANYHQTEAALLFNSGYQANTGLLSCIAQRGDTILYDHLIHASLRDGCRLSFAQSFTYKHNDVADLEMLLQKSTANNLYVVAESVYSMDGDEAPLQAMAKLCKQYGAFLVVDEAHAIGVYGHKGEGLVQHLQLQNKVFARVITYGKAPGWHGAAVVGSAKLKQYLINFSRPFIYTTAMPAAHAATIQHSYAIMQTMQPQRQHLQQLIALFRMQSKGLPVLDSYSPIQAFICTSNQEVKHAAAFLLTQNLDVRPILYPTVPKGAERLRINLHAYNTTAQVDRLMAALKAIPTLQKQESQ